MKTTRFIGVFRLASLLGLILLAGCIPSLHPLYTNDSDIVYEPALIGSWSEEGDDDMWVFSRRGGKEYKLVYTENGGKTGEFIVNLVNIDNHLFLDLFPEEPKIDANSYYMVHLIPAHTFMRVEQIKPSLKIAPLNPEWLSDLLKQTPAALQHEIKEDRPIITAQPKEIQKFLLQHLATEGAFMELSDMKRMEIPDQKPEAEAEQGSMD